MLAYPELIRIAPNPRRERHPRSDPDKRPEDPGRFPPRPVFANHFHRDAGAANNGLSQDYSWVDLNSGMPGHSPHPCAESIAIPLHHPLHREDKRDRVSRSQAGTLVCGCVGCNGRPGGEPGGGLDAVIAQLDDPQPRY
jgi:hypothetical protein